MRISSLTCVWIAAGDWRIVYHIEAERIGVLVVTVGHRREVYERVRELLG